MDNNISGIMKKYKFRKALYNREMQRNLEYQVLQGLTIFSNIRRFNLSVMEHGCFIQNMWTRVLWLMRHCELECGIKVYDRNGQKREDIYSQYI